MPKYSLRITHIRLRICSYPIMIYVTASHYLIDLPANLKIRAEN
jgi:hypothetical protein